MNLRLPGGWRVSLRIQLEVVNQPLYIYTYTYIYTYLYIQIYIYTYTHIYRSISSSTNELTFLQRVASSPPNTT